MQKLYIRAAAGWGLFVRAASLALLLGANVVLARLLGVFAFGLYASALAWTKALIVPVTLGFDRLVVREVAAAATVSSWGRCRGILVSARKATLASSLGLAVVATIIAFIISDGGEGFGTFALAMAALPLLAAIRLDQFALQGLHRPIAALLPETVVQPTLLVAIGVVLFSAGAATATSAMAATVSAYAMALVVAHTLLSRALPEELRSATGEQGLAGRNIAPMLLLSGSIAVSGQIPVLMLATIVGPAEAGIFAVTKSLADTSLMPVLAVNAALAPALASYWTSSRRAEFQSALSRCARMATLLTVPILLLLVLVGPLVLNVFGHEFASGAGPLRVLCAAQFLDVAAGSNAIALVAAGQERWAAVASLGTALLNLSLCAVLIPAWGIYGAAVSTTASVIVWNAILAWRVRQALGLTPSAFARLVPTSNPAGVKA